MTCTKKVAINRHSTYPLEGNPMALTKARKKKSFTPKNLLINIGCYTIFLSLFAIGLYFFLIYCWPLFAIWAIIAGAHDYAAGKAKYGDPR
jgi:hypothetical protein